MQTKNPYFYADEYERSHGKPRGRGSWAFAPYDSPNEVEFFPGTYTEAKKAAAKFFAGVEALRVLP